MSPPRTPVEHQIWLRTRVSIAAYAYELDPEGPAFMTDGEYDKLALEIDSAIKTGNERLDTFFETEFGAHTGQWIRRHPDLKRIGQIWEAIKRAKKAESLGDTE